MVSILSVYIAVILGSLIGIGVGVTMWVLEELRRRR